jgi:hypothetical protein
MKKKSVSDGNNTSRFDNTSDVVSMISTPHDGPMSSMIHPDAHPELRKCKKWLKNIHFRQLQTDGKPMPDEVFDFLETMLLYHISTTDNHNTFVASSKMMTAAINAEVAMTKGDLYELIRKHHEFSQAKVVVFAYLETNFSATSDGHWLLFAVDFSCDTVFVYDSCNLHKGAPEAFAKLQTSFITPHLCYLEDKSGPVGGIAPKGKVSNVERFALRANAFKLEVVSMPITQKDHYSCGFWVTKMML